MHAGILQLTHVFSRPATAAPAASRRPRIEPTESDGELVRRARRGDKWAEEALYHRYVRPVTRVVVRLLARSTEAEDVVQDAFVHALGDLAKLRDDDAFGSWLVRIAVHQVHRRYRRRRLLRALGLDRGEDDTTLSDQMDSRAGPEVRAGLAEIDRLLGTLPTRSRVAWMLRHVEGQELRDVARACDCSLATAKRLVGRAETVISAHVRLEPIATPTLQHGGGDA
jgi:RNA polymerase sigma-70 factor (ECF subfamily)